MIITSARFRLGAGVEGCLGPDPGPGVRNEDAEVEVEAAVEGVGAGVDFAGFLSVDFSRWEEEDGEGEGSDNLLL